MEEKDLYSPEQFEKIQKLRALSEVERQTKKAIMENTKMLDFFSKIEIGDKVFYKQKRGVVIEKQKLKKRSKSDTPAYSYTIKCGIEVFKNVQRYSFAKRVVENYDHVEVCDQIKKMNTRELLSEYRIVSRGTYYPDNYAHLPADFELQMKAELSRREHVPNKKEGSFYRRKNKK